MFWYLEKEIGEGLGREGEDTWRSGTWAGCIQTMCLHLGFSRVVFLHGEGPLLCCGFCECDNLRHQRLNWVIYFGFTGPGSFFWSGVELSGPSTDGTWHIIQKSSGSFIVGGAEHDWALLCYGRTTRRYYAKFYLIGWYLNLLTLICLGFGGIIVGGRITWDVARAWFRFWRMLPWSKLRIIISNFLQQEVSGWRIPPRPVWLKSNNRKKWLDPIIMQRCPWASFKSFS